MKRLKMKMLCVSLMAVVLTLLSQESLAYYSVVGKATNVVTSGEISLMIHETTDQGTEFPVEGVYIVPGDVVSKQVSVENICAHPFYLRVKVVYGVDSQELSAEDCFALDIDEGNWTYHDGWYYYNRVVMPGEETSYVFSEVEIVGSKVDNSYIGKTLTLSVVAQGVQSEHNPLTDGLVYTALGWPQE